MLYLSSGDDNPHIHKARALAAQRQAASLESIAAGGLSLHARERLLKQAARQHTDEHFFTGNLSVNELSLVRQAGYEPLGQVMGSAVCYVAPEWYPQDTAQDGFSFALEKLPQAVEEAQRLGFSRLRQEAALLGATGVVGVRLKTSTTYWEENGQEQERLEFLVFGTAIRERGRVAPVAGEAGSLPFLSNLSGEDFWLLQQGHYRPLDVVCGYMAYVHRPSRDTQGRIDYGQNQEIVPYTETTYKARKLAMAQVQTQAQGMGASGVVGVKIVTTGSVHRLGMKFYFSCVGTAIASQPYSVQAAVQPQTRSRQVVPIVPLV